MREILGGKRMALGVQWRLLNKFNGSGALDVGIANPWDGRSGKIQGAIE
jgi:hypothetical protein